MSDNQTVSCPAEDCDYTGLRKSVLGHYSGKSDTAHKGGYEAAKQQLGDPPRESGGKSTDGSSGGPPAETPQFPTSESGGSENGGSDGINLSCPECGIGANVYTADSVLRMYRKHPKISVGQKLETTLNDAEAACVACGTAFDPE